MNGRLFPSLLRPAEKVTEEQLAVDANIVAMEQVIRAVSRRSFLARMTAAGAAAATVGVLGSARDAEAQAAPAITDVLNFALNLEYLEASLYASVTGNTPPSGGGALTGAPAKLSLDTQTMATANGLYSDEMNHITVLKSAITTLGGTPIVPPAIDLSAGGKYSATTQAQFLMIARQFTAVGNSAYAGAAKYLVSNTTVLTTSAQILGAEGQHLGAVNYLCALQGVNSPAVDALDYPPVPPNTFFTITPTTMTSGPALGPVRTTSQVLGIVYGSSTASTTTPATGITMGGFFPSGFNGNIKST